MLRQVSPNIDSEVSKPNQNGYTLSALYLPV